MNPEEQKRIKREETKKAEKILAIGEEESEKRGASLAHELVKEEEKREKEAEDARKDILDRKTRDLEYKQTLCSFLVEELKTVDWPKGYTWEVKDTERGVAVMFKTKEGRFYGRGFKPCHELEYDLSAVKTLAIRVENTIDRLRPTKTKEGIYIP